MKTVYFGVSKSNRPNLHEEIDQLKNCLLKLGMELMVFVDKYDFKSGEEKAMMDLAFREIDDSDFLIVELSRKAIGVGVEAGYGYAKRKPVIYICKKGSPYSTTVGGVAEHFIEYEQVDDLIVKVEHLLSKF